MKIRLIAIGTRMPDWVTAGYHEFAKRLNDDVRLELVEIAAGKRGKAADIARLTQKEGEAQLAAIGSQDRVVALEVLGKPWRTEDLSQKLRQWLAEGRNISWTLLKGHPYHR